MKYLFITGERRSGTTLITNFLNSQDNIEVYSDFMLSYFNELKNLRIYDLRNKLFDRQRNVLVSSLIAEGMKFNLDITDLWKCNTSDAYEIFTRVLNLVNSDSNNKYIGVKRTSETIYYPKLLNEGVKVIYVYRDPRDVLLSAKNRFGNYNMYKFIREWIDNIKVADSYRNHQNFLMVRYEDFVTNPLKISDEISSFLGTTINASVEHLSMRQEAEFKNNSSFGDLTKLIDEKGKYRWKREPDSEEIHFISRFLKSDLKRFGYDDNINGSQSLLHYYKELILFFFHKYKSRAYHIIKRLF